MVAYLKYKDVEHPIRISYYAIKQFEKDTGKSIDILDEKLEYLETLLWFGLIAGHRVEDKEMTLKRDEMEFMLDECLREFNELILGFFPSGDGSVSLDDKKK